MSSPATSPDASPHYVRRKGVALIAATLAPIPAALFSRHVHPHLTPFNMTVAAVVALVTGGFVTLILLMVMVAANFNLLAAIE
jgi:hypothetical protein